MVIAGRLGTVLALLEAVRPDGRKAGEFFARCPSHNDKTPSLHVTEQADRILLHCFAGCDTVRDVIPALEARGLEKATLFPEQDRYDQSRPSSATTTSGSAPRRTRPAKDGGPEWKFVEEYPYHDEQGQVCFAVERWERLVDGRKEKDFPAKMPDGAGRWKSGRKGARLVPYRLQDITKAGPTDVIFIAEGEKDANNLAKLYVFATTNPGGARNWSPELNQHFKGRRVVILPDNDEPGKQHAETVTNHLLPIAARVATLDLEGRPEKGDVSDWIAAGGTTDKLLELAEQALKASPEPPKQVLRMSDCIVDLLHLYDVGIQPGVSTGFAELDAFYTVKKSYFTVINGIPGNGKSTFIDGLIVNLIRLHGWRIAVLSLEVTPPEFYYATLAEKYLKRSFNAPSDFASPPERARPSRAPRMTRRELEGLARGEFNDRLLLLNPAEQNCNVEWVIETARSLHNDTPLDAILIDPWNELDHGMDAQKNEAHYLQETLRKLRRFIRSINVHLFIVAHPRLMEPRADGSYPVPSPYDLSGGAMWRNKADCMLSVWRDLDPDRDSRILEVYVQKIKQRFIGKTGKVFLYYDGGIGSYTSIPADYKATDDYITAIAPSTAATTRGMQTRKSGR